ncbi:MAG: hypothetical protein HWD81_00630 [Marivivens sp.]|jgi:hypothetical protein|nr:hypothetical protein [Marivivens sp.]
MPQMTHWNLHTSHTVKWNDGLRIGRRELLALFAAVPLLGVANTSFSQSRTFEEKVFIAFLDMLIPRDETSPPASELSLSDRLIDLGRSIPNYLDMIFLGAQWLQSASMRSSGKSFDELPLVAKFQLTKAAFSQPIDSLPFVFANRIKDDALTLYYSHPASWSVVGLESPIQPNGYPDFMKEPSA